VREDRPLDLFNVYQSPTAKQLLSLEMTSGDALLTAGFFNDQSHARSLFYADQGQAGARLTASAILPRLAIDDSTKIELNQLG
jgi:hypothetical protein